jgi:glycosyltransferase involved in cell wall biosynthesis
MNKIKEKARILIIGANISDDFKASSVRVRNLFDTIIDNSSFIVINILYHNEIKESILDYATNTKIIIKNGIFKYFSILQSLYKQKQANSNIVLYNYGYVNFYNILILVWAKIIGIPIVFDIVENNQIKTDYKSIFSKPKHVFNKFFGKRIHLFASKIFVISNNLMKLITEFSKNRIPIVHIPISVRLREWDNINLEMEKPKQIIFYGGSFGPKDGLEYLIDAFQNISNEFPHVELQMSGRGAIRHINIIKEKIATTNCQDRIFLLGTLNRGNYIKKIHESDITCVTRTNSVFANSGFPFKLGEYLAAAKVIVVSRVSDIDHYLEDKKDVWMVNPESVNEIEMGLRVLLKDIEMRKELSLNARKKAELYFDSLVVGAKFQDEIESLIFSK